MTQSRALQRKEKSVLAIANKHVIKYRPDETYVNWVRNGLVATVLYGESIPLVQQHVLDVGFENLVIIPLDADKVLLKCSGDSDVNSILTCAADFFKSFFTNVVGWNQDCVKFERGAWICLYGIPLQAWNENFFQLCVFLLWSYVEGGFLFDG